jgi:ribonuclease P protein component
MFLKESRLLKSEDFGFVFKKPLKVSGQSFDLYVRANQLGRARLGLAVPKKAIKQAVSRNRIKRVLRECFRQKQANIQGFDVVVVVKKPMNDVPRTEQTQVVAHHWQQMMVRLRGAS